MEGMDYWTVGPKLTVLLGLLSPPSSMVCDYVKNYTGTPSTYGGLYLLKP